MRIGARSAGPSAHVYTQLVDQVKVLAADIWSNQPQSEPVILASESTTQHPRPGTEHRKASGYMMSPVLGWSLLFLFSISFIFSYCTIQDVSNEGNWVNGILRTDLHSFTANKEPIFFFISFWLFPRCFELILFKSLNLNSLFLLFSRKLQNKRLHFSVFLNHKVNLLHFKMNTHF